MRRQSPLPFAVIAAVFVLLAGCKPQEPFFLRDPKDPTYSHYKAVSMEIEYPRVESESLADVLGAIKPFSVNGDKPKEYWDLRLEEVMRITLENNKIIRTLGGQVSPQAPIDNLIRNPDAVASIYDPALMETNPRFGTEAALSAFDTQWTTNVFWQKVDTPQNTQSFLQTDVLQGDNATFVTQLQKINATGSTSTIRHNVQYAMTNQPAVLFPSDWNVNLEVEARQPLLRGAGVQYNRIAGPGAQPGQYAGVMLARLNTDIALADFEAAVRNLVAETEEFYWELYFNYRSLDSVKAGRDSALATWQKIDALRREGARGGDASSEAQAREQYYRFRGTVEQGLASLYETEARLRYLMGIAATDGRLIRPVEEPTTAKVTFDWYEVTAEALVRSVELRRIKFGVQRRELELIASKNFLLPQFDVDALYRWRGLGNNLLSSSRTPGDFNTPGSNAYQSLTSGQFQEWQVGLIMQMPLGFRRELSTVRNSQLALSKERAVLREAELTVSHSLATAWRRLESDYHISLTFFNERIAAQGQVEAVEAAYDTGTIQIDVLLQAQRLLAQAEADYYRSLVEYNKDIMKIHKEKGSLLEYNGVYLSEGPWPGKAYFDARRRARARDAATYIDYGFTQPRVISEGPYQQHAGKSLFGSETTEMEKLPETTPLEPETLPTPTPELRDPGYNQQNLEPMPAEPSPAPEPDATTVHSATAARKAIAGQKGASKAKPAGRKTFDVSTLLMGEMEEKPVRQASAVQPVTGNRSAKIPQKSSKLQWTESKRKPAYESQGNPSAAESGGSASGWQGIQR